MIKSVLLLVLFFILIIRNSNSQVINYEEHFPIISGDNQIKVSYNNTSYITCDTTEQKLYSVYNRLGSIYLVINNLIDNSITSKNIYTGIIVEGTAALFADYKLWICWAEKSGVAQQIKLISTADSGINLSEVYTIDSPGKNSAPSFSNGNDGAIYVAWHSEEDSSSSIYFSRYEAAVDSFTSPTIINPSKLNGSFVSVLGAGDTVFAVWKEKRLIDSYDVYFNASTDKGTNWHGEKKIYNNNQNGADPSIAYTEYGSPKGIIYTAHQFLPKSIGLSRSTDFGFTWSPMDTISSNGLFARIIISENGFAAIKFEYFRRIDLPVQIDSVKDVGFAYSFDYGDSWINDATVFLNNHLGSVYPAITSGLNDQYFLGYMNIESESERKIYLRKFNVDYSTTGIGSIETTPLNFMLLQNHPNPFNPSTIISYNLDVASHVTLKVFDVLGREAATLTNENKSAGFYTIEFDASSLSNGVYFYKLQSGNFYEIKKMILMR